MPVRACPPSPDLRAREGRPSRLVAALCLLACGPLFHCGYVGEPKPPATYIPKMIADLRAEQSGAQLQFQFTLPSLTTEEMTLTAVQQVEFRVDAIPATGFDRAAWEANARLVAVNQKEPGEATVTLPAQEWVGREVAAAVRTQGRRGRWSAWSNFATLRVKPPLPAPTGLRAEATATGARLSWAATPGAERYRVFRNQVPLAEAAEAAFVDAAAEMGQTYQYQVQALAGTNVTSPLSPAQSLTLEDRFPPATPEGLVLLESGGAVEVSWARNTEADFLSYRLLRAAGAEPLKEIATDLTIPAYRDRNVTKGKYRYAVVAKDRAGNESQPSPPQEIELQ